MPNLVQSKNKHTKSISGLNPINFELEARGVSKSQMAVILYKMAAAGILEML